MPARVRACACLRLYASPLPSTRVLAPLPLGSPRAVPPSSSDSAWTLAAAARWRQLLPLLAGSGRLHDEQQDRHVLGRGRDGHVEAADLGQQDPDGEGLQEDHRRQRPQHLHVRLELRHDRAVHQPRVLLLGHGRHLYDRLLRPRTEPYSLPCESATHSRRTPHNRPALSRAHQRDAVARQALALSRARAAGPARSPSHTGSGAHPVDSLSCPNLRWSWSAPSCSASRSSAPR